MSGTRPVPIQRGWSHDLAEPVGALAWSPDGRTLAAGTASGRLALIGDRGRTIVNEAAHTGRITALAFRPGGEQVVSAGEDGWLRFWHPARRGAEFRLDLGAPVSRIAFRSDGERLAAASGRRVLVAERTARVVCAVTDQPEPVTGLAWTLSGRRVLVTAGGAGLLVFDAVSGRRMGGAVGLRAVSLAANADGTRFVVEDDRNGLLRLLQLTTDRPAYCGDVARGVPGEAGFALDAEGRLLAVLGEGHLETWSIAGELRRLARRAAAPAPRIAFDGGGRLLALASGRRLELLDAGTARVVATIDAPAGEPVALCWTRRARGRAALAVATGTGRLDVFEIG